MKSVSYIGTLLMLCGCFYLLLFTTGVEINSLFSFLFTILLSFFVIKFLFEHLLLSKGKGKATYEDIKRDQEEEDLNLAIEAQIAEALQAQEEKSSRGNGGSPDPKKPSDDEKPSSSSSAAEKKENLNNSNLPTDNNTSNPKPQDLKRKHSELDSDVSEEPELKRLKEKSLNSSELNTDSNTTTQIPDSPPIFSDGTDDESETFVPISRETTPKEIRPKKKQSKFTIDYVVGLLKGEAKKDEDNTDSSPNFALEALERIPNKIRLEIEDLTKKAELNKKSSKPEPKDKSPKKDNNSPDNDNVSDDGGGDAGGGE